MAVSAAASVVLEVTAGAEAEATEAAGVAAAVETAAAATVAPSAPWHKADVCWIGSRWTSLRRSK